MLARPFLAAAALAACLSSAFGASAAEGPSIVTRLPDGKHDHRGPLVSGKLEYLGGQVMQNIEIVSVLWTANVDPNAVSKLPSFYKDLLASSYFDLLGEYYTGGVTPVDGQAGTTQGVSHGSYKAQYTITPSVCATTAACTVTDTQIAAELAAQVAAKKLPEPTVGCDGFVSTLYVIEFPANVTISLTIDGMTSESCSAFCGYHNHTTIGGKVVPYGVLPDLESGACASTCSETPPAGINDVTSVHSHEVAEAITDTNVTIDTTYVRPSAWGATSGGEIGDLCNFDEQAVSLNGTTWTVQELWSNAVGACSVTGMPQPLCTAMNTPAGCRACYCSDDGTAKTPESDSSCGGKTPSCETRSANVKLGFCVACTADAACGTGMVCEDSATASKDDVCEKCGGKGEPCCANDKCTMPDTCGGGGTKGACGCTPKKSCPTADMCGEISDGCGGMVKCGTCPSGQTCGSDNTCSATSTGPDGGADDGGTRPESDGGPGGTSPTPGGDTAGSGGGCGCVLGASPPATAGLGGLGLLAVLGVGRRRSRRRVSERRLGP